MASSSCIVCLLLLVLCLTVPSLATVYTVGDSSGWTMGVDYTTWTSGKTFVLGDSLVFNYGSGHTVDEVSGSDYNSCTVGNSIATDNSGPTTILLNTAGTHYYICGVIGHCGSGMKLAVTVTVTDSGSTAAAPSGSPPLSPTTIPPPPTIVITQPRTFPVSSSSGVLSPFVAMMLYMSVALFKFVVI